MKSDLVYFAPFAPGGLCTYAAQQISGIEAAGVALSGVVSPAVAAFFPNRTCGEMWKVIAPPREGRALLWKYRQFRHLMECYRLLDGIVRAKRPRAVLFGSFAEYFSPLWAWRFRKLREERIRFGCVVHDPVRDFQFGPAFWHKWSISEAYSFIDVAFLHETIELNTGSPARDVESVIIPHGPYPVPQGRGSRARLREEFNIPDSAFVVLAFGHIRDGKNLDLLLKAAQQEKNVWLVIAGREQSSGQKRVAHYQRIADSLGLAGRCKWHNSFIPEDEIWKYFEVADCVALTYSSEFRSASGVLNLNAQFGRPVLASGGEGPLKSAVRHYNLGVWVEPDSSEALAGGLRQVMKTADRNHSGWTRYRKDHSWHENVNRIVAALLE